MAYGSRVTGEIRPSPSAMERCPGPTNDKRTTTRTALRSPAARSNAAPAAPLGQEADLPAPLQGNLTAVGLSAGDVKEPNHGSFRLVPGPDCCRSRHQFNRTALALEIFHRFFR